MSTEDLMVQEIAELRMEVSRQKVMVGRYRLALVNVIEDGFRAVDPRGDDPIPCSFFLAQDLLNERPNMKVVVKDFMDEDFMDEVSSGH